MKSIQSFSWLTVSFTIHKLLVIHILNMKYSWSCSPENKPNDWWSFTYLLQLVPSMTTQVLLGVGHLLLTIKAKHASHQCRSTLLSPIASGCTIYCYALAPGANPLPRYKWHGRDPALFKRHRNVKPILHQVDFSHHFPLAKMLHTGMGSLGSENIPIVSHSVTATNIIKHETLMVIHLNDYLHTTFICYYKKTYSGLQLVI